MSVIDEDRLRTLLSEAGTAIAPPPGGPDRILAEAAASGHPAPVVRSVVPRSTRGRVALVAAVVVLVVAGVSLAGPGTAGHARAHPVATSSALPPPARPAAPGGASGGTTPGVGPAIGGSRAPAVASAPSTGGGSSGAGASTGAGSGGTASGSPSPSLPPGVVGQSAKVVTTGSVDLAVTGSVGAAVTTITHLASAQGGFVARSQLQLGSAATAGGSYGSLVLQVPQASFTDLLGQVARVGKVTSESSTSTDVTGQYVDLQARISALQSSRQQYLTILSKATSIGDILAVQSQLDTVQSQIEQLQGQLDLLTSQTSYAALTVSLSKQGHPVPPPPVASSGLTKAWHDSVGGFTSGVEWLVRIAGRTLFVLILLALAFLAGRWAWRTSRRRLL